MIRASALSLVLGVLLAACSPQGPVKCTAANCSGCCTEAGECLGATKQSPMACGAMGGSCRVCLPQQLCVAGSCTQNPDASVILDDGGVPMDVDAGQPDSGQSCGARGQACCANLMCNLTLTCQRGVCDLPGTATDAGSCGALNQACCAGQSCTAAGTTCQSGTCLNAPADAGALKATGEACQLDRECADGTCLVLGFSSGYCTKACTTSANCTAGSQCGTNPAGTPAKVCLKQCSMPNQAPGGCRTGYVCEPHADTGGQAVCFPACTSNTMCGTAPSCDARGFCCGSAGAACCEGANCEPGNACMNGTCQASNCGSAGQACCTTGTQCMGSAVCVSNVCTLCGGAGEPCCAGNTCTTGTCTSGTCQTAASCGNAGQACCSSGAQCLGTLTCQTGLCSQPAACGAVEQPCCANSMCNAGGICQSGTCRAKTGGACSTAVYCEGNACLTNASSLTWAGGYCSGTCTGTCPSGSSCAPYVVTGTSYCLQNCTWDGAQGSCRSGYVCDRYLTGSFDPPTCVAACASAGECPITGRCSNGFCCGKKFYRCCASGTPCDTGTCTNGYCQ